MELGLLFYCIMVGNWHIVESLSFFCVGLAGFHIDNNCERLVSLRAPNLIPCNTRSFRPNFADENLVSLYQ